MSQPVNEETMKRGGEETSFSSRFVWLYGLSAILFLYAALSFYQIDLPGLHYDEAFEAVPALQLWQGQPVVAFRNNGVILAGQLFPLMTQDYIGALNTYLAIPFIALLGPTPAALRVMSILVGGTTLGLTYLLAYRLSGQPWVGWSAALLLAVDPTFIFWNRQGIFVTAITAAIGLAATLCWLHRIRVGGTRWTMTGAFLFGLGLYAKLLFVWLIVALLGAVIVLNLAQWLRQRAEFRNLLKTNSPEFLLALTAFLLGCAPLIVYNIQTGGTFLNVTQNAATSYYGVNNLAFGSNLWERLGQFGVVLNGSHLWYLGQVISNPVPLIVFGLILILVLIKSLKSPSPPAQIVLFPFLVIGLVVLASIGTVSALWVTHFALLMPWPALALALGAWYIGQRPQPSNKVAGSRVTSFTFHVSRFIMPLVLGLVVITNLVNAIRYHLTLTESGGLSSHSDAIYDLSDWLVAHAGSPVAAMDWGLAAPVTYLSGGRVVPTEVFGYIWESDAELTPRLQRLMAEPATLYLWRAPAEVIFDRSQEFKALYRPLKREETIEAAFYERSGRPLLGITRLVPQGSAANPPK